MTTAWTSRFKEKIGYRDLKMFKISGIGGDQWRVKVSNIQRSANAQIWNFPRLQRKLLLLSTTSICLLTFFLNVYGYIYQVLSNRHRSPPSFFPSLPPSLSRPFPCTSCPSFHSRALARVVCRVICALLQVPYRAHSIWCLTNAAAIALGTYSCVTFDSLPFI